MTVEERFTVPQGTIVRHFKNSLYVIRGIAKYSEDINKKFVIYQKINADVSFGELYVREEEMFCSEVDHDKYPNAQQKYRFEYVGHLTFLSSKVKERNKQIKDMYLQECNSENGN